MIHVLDQDRDGHISIYEYGLFVLAIVALLVAWAATWSQLNQAAAPAKLAPLTRTRAFPFAPPAAPRTSAHKLDCTAPHRTAPHRTAPLSSFQRDEALASSSKGHGP